METTKSSLVSFADSVKKLMHYSLLEKSTKLNYS